MECVLTERTNQSCEIETFGEETAKSLVAQIKGPYGTRKAQIVFAPGLCHPPAKTEKLQVVEINSGLYAVSGYCPGLAEELGATDGETVIFCTDETGEIKGKIFMEDDGAITVSNDAGSISLGSSGQVNINNGNLTVET